MDLQYVAAKNSWWRSSTTITPRTGGSNSHHGKGKAPMLPPMSGFGQKYSAGFGQNTLGTHGSFGYISNKDVSNTMKSWGRSKKTKSRL